jgi:sugar-specific transcriptional regulator TrmB
MDNKRVEEILESIGLSRNEVIIYLELIRMGDSSVSGLAKTTKLHRSNIYDTIGKLTKKGIVKLVFIEEKKFFRAISPEELLKYFKQREYDLESVISLIKERYNRPEGKNNLILSEGIQSIRSLIDSLLEMNQPIYTYGITRETVNTLGGFIHDFHKRRIKKKIPIKHIYNEDAVKRINELNKMPFTEARYLPSLYNTKMILRYAEIRLLYGCGISLIQVF